MKVLLVCERSGGHVFPALILAKQMRDYAQVSFFVSSPFFKERLERQGFKVYGRSFPFRNLIIEGAWRLFEAVYILGKLKPDKVIGFGGRDSFFLVLFSSWLSLDTVIYELNKELGLANRVLSWFVHQVWCGFSEGVRGVDKRKIKAVGIPLRPELSKIDKGQARQQLGLGDKPVVLCFGGSQGAAFINKVFMKFIQEGDCDCQVIHITGHRDYLAIRQLYNKIHTGKFVRDFYEAMEALYSAADIAISRAGASTVAELVYYQLPAVLIPHPQGSGHQKENAYYLKQRKSAFVFCEDDFSFAEFKDTVSKLINDGNLRQAIKDNLARIKLGVKPADFAPYLGE